MVDLPNPYLDGVDFEATTNVRATLALAWEVRELRRTLTPSVPVAPPEPVTFDRNRWQGH